MAKNYSNRNKKRKALIAMLCALSVTCTGLAAACAPTEEEEPSNPVTAKEDTQLLKNGDFEHFDIPADAIHLIKNVNSWTLSGGTSVMSGIVGTATSEWNKLTDEGLAEKLDYNNDLSADNEEYVNYNSMRSRDIPYKDTYAATLEEDKVEDSWITKHDGGYEGYFGIEKNGDKYFIGETEVFYNSDDKEFYLDEGCSKLIRKELIKNPGTHYALNEDETKVTVDGKEYDVKKDEDSGSLYYVDGEEEVYFSNVLMLHNAGTNTDNNGLQQYYTSTSISLEAHTSAEISLWVKTSDLKFNKGYAATAEEEDKGAFIEVVQNVASTTLDTFQIKAINTENIITSAGNSPDVTLPEDVVSNGWVKYTVYVNACDFANTSIQLRLGLGGSKEDEKVTGYAFFDDVQVKKYRELEEKDTDCTFKDHKTEISDNGTSCYLTSDEKEKIFYADVTNGKNADKKLHTYDFHYLIDLSSMEDSDKQQLTYQPIAFGSNVKVGLTTEKNSNDVEYAAAKTFAPGSVSDVLTKKQPATEYNIPKDVKARPTDEDIIKVFGEGDNFDDSAYSKLLNNLTGDNGADKLPAAAGGNSLVLFSAWGAPYTATISGTDQNKFTLANDEYMLVSFWVKTSDMDGNTAATVKIYEYKCKDGKPTDVIDENSVKTLTIDTTDRTTDFEDQEDIYNGWVQCFFFVKNDTGAKDEDGKDIEKTFKIDFSFGATGIISTTSYKSGYAAIANLQTLKINEDIYGLASAGDTTALFSFTKDSEKNGGKAFSDASGTDDVNKGLARPSGYTGTNADNVSGNLTNTANKNVFVDAEEKLNAGLINRDAFNDETSAIVTSGKAADILSFFTSTGKWDEAFDENCCQPLIIINNLREYAVVAKADKDTFDNGTYYIKNDDGTYTQVKEGDEFDADKTYYSFKEVVNYGFVGSEKSVSANGREVVSVRVKVTGNAVAYIYLIDTDTDELLNFTTPSITFWYDEEGNVLDEELDEDWSAAEHREHIVYKLRKDGLYEDKNGKLFANLNNLAISYSDSKFENVAYFHANGDPVVGGYDYIEKYGDGKTYFYKENGEKADHYLCATDGTHVYEYVNGKYYYVEITTDDEGNTTETTNLDKEVSNFATNPRYTQSEIAETLFATVTKEDCDTLGANDDGWVTVNFVIKAGSEAKNYRLELWSGERDKDGVDGYDPDVKSAVAFDYVHGTVSENRLTAYEKEIINAYNKAIEEAAPELLKDEALGRDANIADYEKVLNAHPDEKAKVLAKMTGYVDAEGKLTYTASYYTYTLYDSAAYVPFNAETAGDGETGYDYDPASFSEQLAYFEFNDKAHSQKNVFVDYSAVDQSITKNTTPNDDADEEDQSGNAGELWLYIASIVLVIVLLITLVSILLRKYVKQARVQRETKNASKNVYRKRDRYVKKLHLIKDEMVEPENGKNDAEEVPAEEVTPVENEVTEIPEEVEPSTVETNDGEDKE